MAVDDCGTVLNPMIVEGQVHGGLTQGLAPALWEGFVYSPEGQPLTANFADYLVPSTCEVPSFETISLETPSPLNPLGAKGLGESGTIGSTSAAVNAVLDALAPLGAPILRCHCHRTGSGRRYRPRAVLLILGIDQGPVILLDDSINSLVE
ncbi:MAG: molybdopterin cofactor-binding domain-containing protein [Actinomycetota bacterium]